MLRALTVAERDSHLANRLVGTMCPLQRKSAYCATPHSCLMATRMR